MAVSHFTRYTVTTYNIMVVMVVAGLMLTLWRAHPSTWSAGNSYLGLHMIATPLEANFRAGPDISAGATNITGLIIINALTGQQGSIMKGLLSFQCWVAPLSLPMTILELAFTKVMKLSDLVDFQQFNHASSSHGEPLLAKGNESFPSNIIVVNKFQLARDCRSKNYSATALENAQDGTRKSV